METRDFENIRGDEPPSKRQYREEDDLVSRRLPSLIEEDRRLVNGFSNDCPICFHNIPFNMALKDPKTGNDIIKKVEYGLPIEQEVMMEWEETAQKAIDIEGTMSVSTPIQLAAQINEYFQKLNTRITEHGNKIKYKEISAKKVKDHFMGVCKQTEQSIINSDLMQLNKITNDMYNSESTCWQSLTRKTAKNKQELKFNERHLGTWAKLLTIKHRTLNMKIGYMGRMGGGSEIGENRFLE